MATEKSKGASKKDAKAKGNEAAAAEPTTAAAAPEPAPRQPADPRLKFWKKFHGKFLPRGPLRDRFKAIEARWNSDENHGGVTVEELKGLLADWSAARAKPSKATAAAK